jgi:hypothetical protein
VSNALSPIFYLFLIPSGVLYQKVQHLLAEDEPTEGSHTPSVIKHRRPGPKYSAYGIPASKWSTVVQRVVEQKEPLRSVAAAYGVSHELIRRLILHGQQAAWTARSLAVQLLFLRQMRNGALASRELADARGPHLHINLPCIFPAGCWQVEGKDLDSPLCATGLIST